jgi:hypothetical protein
MVQRKSFSYKQFKIELQNEVDFLITEMSKDWKLEIRTIQSHICKTSDFDSLNQLNLEMNGLFEMINSGNKFRNNFCNFFSDFVKEIAVYESSYSSVPVDECDEHAFVAVTTAMNMLNKFDVDQFPEEVVAFSWLWEDSSTFFQSAIYHSFVEDDSRCGGFQVHQNFKVKQSQLS